MDKWIIGLFIAIILICAGVVSVHYYLGNGDEDKEIVKYERYEELKSQWFSICGNYWAGQIFTVGATGPDEAHYIDNISLYMSSVGQPDGLVTLVITETKEKYLGLPIEWIPYGKELTRATLDIEDVPDVWFDWVSFDLTDVVLQPNGIYAMILFAPNANDTAFIRWERVHDDGTYPGGHAVASQDGGLSWGTVPDSDYAFIEYGYV